MELVRRIHSMKEVCRQARSRGRTIGFVPTMGALHEGHQSLIRGVKEMVDIVVVSIFVNPTQFLPGEDLESYPRDLTRDVDLCVSEQVDYVFAPEVEEVYPEGAQTSVEVSEISRRFEGEYRPGHFRGVCTILSKLFHIVNPNVAAFGQKDAQQAAVVRQMVRDLVFDVEVLVLPIVRDEDGLALSSRNVRLSAEEREVALCLPRAIQAAREAARDGARTPASVRDAANAILEEQEDVTVDYLEVIDPVTFDVAREWSRDLWIIAAIRVGDLRLIDNGRFDEEDEEEDDR